MKIRKSILSVGFYLMLALLLLIVPFRWLVAMIIAAGFHEICHYILICLMTGDKVPIYLSTNAVRMPIPNMEPWKELLCALAGPCGGFLLTFFSPIFPRLAICAFIQSVYNLIPVHPMDGGRVLACILQYIFFPPTVGKILSFVTMVVRFVLLCLGLYAAYAMNFGIFPILLTLLICIRIK